MSANELTFYSQIKNASKISGDRPFIHMDDYVVTYKEFDQMVSQFSVKLLKNGVKENDHVGLWSVNSIQMIVALHSILRIGATAVLINYSFNINDSVNLLKSANTKFLLYGSNKVVFLDSNAPFKVAKEAGISESNIYNIDLNNGIDASEKEIKDIEKHAEKLDSKRASIIIFTTGTKSTPKPVMLSEFSLLSNAFAYEDDILKGNHKLLIALPLFHSYGLFALNVAMIHEYEVYVEPSLDPTFLLDVIEKEKITDITSVSSLFSKMLALPNFTSEKVNSVLHCIIGGGFSFPLQIYKFEEAFKNGCFLNGYGQTEASAVITCVKASDPINIRANSVGKPLNNAKVYIVDGKDNKLPVGEVGEIIVKGNLICDGYYNMPSSDQPFDHKGYLHTGDLGYFDEDGYLYLEGRIKDIIIRSGENISPKEVEDVIATYPNVKSVKVFGANNSITGESVECCLVANSPLDTSELKKYLKTVMPSFKVPEDYFIYDQFPILENGKIDDRTLKASMLNKLKKLNIERELSNGKMLLDMIFKNSSFMTASCLSAIESISNAIGFSHRKTHRIVLASEEMLIERISNAYSSVGDIRVRAILTTNTLRIIFSDSGEPYDINKNLKEGISAKIILYAVDYFNSTSNKDATSIETFDFIYDNDIDMVNFLFEKEDK